MTIQTDPIVPTAIGFSPGLAARHMQTRGEERRMHW